MCSLLALIAILAQASPAPVPTPQSLAVVELRAPAARLRVQVARTEDQRERGLMGVRFLPPHTGMIFVFSQDGPQSFWMKDTLIPLDMVFISGNGVGRSVAARVATVPLEMPDDAIPLELGRAKYVLELPSAEAAADGLRAGVKISKLPE